MPDIVPAVAQGGGMFATPRQQEILKLLAIGLSDHEVAGRLGISHATVRSHLARLFQEYQFRNRTQAVAAWLAKPDVDPNSRNLISNGLATTEEASGRAI